MIKLLFFCFLNSQRHKRSSETLFRNVWWLSARQLEVAMLQSQRRLYRRPTHSHVNQMFIHHTVCAKPSVRKFFVRTQRLYQYFSILHAHCHNSLLKENGINTQHEFISLLVILNKVAKVVKKLCDKAYIERAEK